jgi:hypothetical protein
MEEVVQQPIGAIGASREARGIHGNGAAGTAARRAGQPEVAGRIAESYGTDSRPDSQFVPEWLAGQAAECRKEAVR